jgi:pyrroline-5-carboxylate reductase
LKIGIIGVGRMGSALVEGLLGAGVRARDIWVSDKDSGKLERMRSLGVRAASKEEVLACEVVFLAVKPKEVGEVLDEISGFRNILVSVVAGVPLKAFGRLEGAKVLRVMPNLLCRRGEGAMALCPGRADARSVGVVKELLSKLGRVIEMEEGQLDVVTALSGSGPAFFARLLEAAVEEAVKLGLPKESALELAAQTMRGVGGEVLEGRDPEDIVESVTSPGGTTEAGLKELGEVKPLRKAIRKAWERARELAGQV